MSRLFSPALLASAVLLVLAAVYPSIACCPAPPNGKWVLNADQTVIMLWDPAAKRQHFIRQANFQADAKDFGFLVPSPTQPELAESGNAAFSTLEDYTRPQVIVNSQGGGGCNLGCSSKSALPGAAATKSEVRVLEEKLVAGFQATVLEADDAAGLVKWLEENGYAYSPAVAEWAAPYIEQNWKFTALKVAAKEEGATSGDSATQTVEAKALRISFETERPLFPYREPDYAKEAGEDKSKQDQLAAAHRLLRIYFISDARYDGELTKDQPWTGQVAWAGKLADHQRTSILQHLQLPPETGPQEFYLTEFEDQWPYKVAPADVYFSTAATQTEVRRPPVYVSRGSGADVSLAVLVLIAFTLPLLKRHV